jgi:hypothetical protein
VIRTEESGHGRKARREIESMRGRRGSASHFIGEGAWFAVEDLIAAEMPLMAAAVIAEGRKTVAT